MWKGGIVVENGVFSCVPSCLRGLGHFERCDGNFAELDCFGIASTEKELQSQKPVHSCTAHPY